MALVTSTPRRRLTLGQLPALWCMLDTTIISLKVSSQMLRNLEFQNVNMEDNSSSQFFIAQHVSGNVY